MKKVLVICLAVGSMLALAGACGDGAGQTVATPLGAAGTALPTAGAGPASGAAGGGAGAPASRQGSAASPAGGSGPSAAGSGNGAMAEPVNGTRPSGTSGSAAVGSAGDGAPSGEGSPEPGGSEGQEPTPPVGDGAPPAKVRRAVSADFLHQTLSVVDIDKLTEGATRADALICEVDLRMYTPGPLAVAVTPDGKTAIASVSAGWLGLVGNEVPAGMGTMVFADLETCAVTGELFTGADPMGIAITKDGKYAYVGQMSSTYMAYIDIAAKSYTMIPTGNSWNEELALDETGDIGILSTGTGGDAMTFTASDGASMRGQTRGLSGDAGGVAFFPGTLFAFVVQAPTQLTGNTGGYNVIDAKNPASPQVTDENRVVGDTRVAYPVTSVKNRKSIVYPSFESNTLSLLEFGVDASGKATQMQALMVGPAQNLAYGLSSSAEGVVLAAVGTDHYVAVVDLNTGKSHTVAWEQTETGPLDIRYIPDPAN